jgi:CBS domain-containing protein
MTREVIAVRPETQLKEVARLLVEHRIGGVPVVDAANKVLGVVSESDFAIKERGGEYIPHVRLGWLFSDVRRNAARVAARTAGEAMSAPAVTIEGRIAAVREAATTMVEHNINRLPVTEDGRLIGIITRGDLVRMFVQPDTAIAERLRANLRAVDGLVVDVEDGIVTLAGTVETQALAETAARIAAGFDGIVAVNSDQLTWRVEPRRESRLPVGLA